MTNEKNLPRNISISDEDNITLELDITQDMVDDFRIATKDTNPIHNSNETKNPIALGFQLEFILKHMADSIIKSRVDSNDVFYHSQKTSFGAKVYVPSQITANAFADEKGNISVSMQSLSSDATLPDQLSDVVKKGSYVKYASQLPDGKGIEFEGGIIYKMMPENIMRTSFGLGLKYADVLAYAISLSSAGFIQTLSNGTSKHLISNIADEFFNPDHDFVYLSHVINAYEKVSDLADDDSVIISLTGIQKREIRGMPLYNLTMAGFNEKHEPIYQVKTMLAQDLKKDIL